MGMAHSTSARRGFEDRHILPNDSNKMPNQSINFDTVKAMLIRENELRLSDKFANKYQAEAMNGLEGYCFVSEQIQLEVTKEFGTGLYGLEVLQTAEQLFPDRKEEIKELSLYRKFNRMVDGNLAVGATAPGVSVVDVSGQLTQLFEEETYPTESSSSSPQSLSVFRCERGHDRPLVLIAGSVS